MNNQEFWYEFDLGSETASFGYGNVLLGKLYFPYLRQKQIHLEYAIFSLRANEKLFHVYKNKVSGRG